MSDSQGLYCTMCCLSPWISTCSTDSTAGWTTINCCLTPSKDIRVSVQVLWISAVALLVYSAMSIGRQIPTFKAKQWPYLHMPVGKFSWNYQIFKMSTIRTLTALKCWDPTTHWCSFIYQENGIVNQLRCVNVKTLRTLNLTKISCWLQGASVYLLCRMRQEMW